MSSGELQIM